jgi:hypothetical protein
MQQHNHNRSLDDVKVEEIELEPSHRQQRTIIEVEGIREEIGETDGEQF